MNRAPHLLAVLLVAAAGCARTPDVADAPVRPVCREVVSLDDGRPPDVAWIGAVDDRDILHRARLMDWCAMVGPLIFEPQPQASRVPARPIDRVALVSWNAHVGAGDVGALLDAVQRGAFTRGEPFDAIVLLLQEVYRHGDGVPDRPTLRRAIPSRIADAFHAAHRRDVRRVARERGLAVLYTPSMRNGAARDDPEDRGNAILSTLALSDAAAIELPFERQRRVVAVASVAGRTSAGAAWRLRVANVHLDTALAPLHGGPLAARRRQTDALIAALTRSLSFEGPTVLAGDFNAWLGEREPAIRDVRAVFPDAPPVDRGATWRGPLGLHATLDYVFARGAVGSIQVQRLPSRFGSDHYPLLAVIGF